MNLASITVKYDSSAPCAVAVDRLLALSLHLRYQEIVHERTDKALTVSIVSRRDFFGFSWERVKICLTVGNQAIIAS